MFIMDYYSEIMDYHGLWIIMDCGLLLWIIIVYLSIIIVYLWIINDY